MQAVVNSLSLFILAALCEVGGGYLIWLWLREKYSLWYGILGAVVIVFYGIIPTLQPFPTTWFGRIYAAYGGFFILLSILWGWGFYQRRPDRFDLIGVAICMVGVAVIIYSPRGSP